MQAKFYGRSMQPTLKEGMLIEVDNINPQAVRPADIIVYGKGSPLIAHRVVRILKKDKKTLYLTKGDNHAYRDLTVIPEEDLIGVVRSAFYEKDLKRDILIKNKLIQLLYVIIGNLVFWVRKRRDSIPKFIRSIFKLFVGGFFLGFKKAIHLIHSLIEHEHLFLRRLRA